HLGDVVERNGRAVDDVFNGAVGHDAHLVPPAFARLDLHFLENQRLHHFVDVIHEIFVFKVRDDMPDRAANVGGDQVDQLRGLLRKALHVQIVVDENRGNIDAV